MDNMIDSYGTTIDIVVPVGQTTTAGQPTDLGLGNGHMFLPMSDGVAGDRVAFVLEGIADLAAETAGAWDQGETLYWQVGNNVVSDTQDAATDPIIGIAMAEKVAAETTNYVKLTPGAWEVVQAGLAGQVGIKADPGDAGVLTGPGSYMLTSGAVGETRTIAAAAAANEGELLVIALDTDGGGDVVITPAADVDQAGNNTIALADAGDSVTLVCVTVGGVAVWRVLGDDGATIYTV